MKRLSLTKHCKGNTYEKNTQNRKDGEIYDFQNEWLVGLPDKE